MPAAIEACRARGGKVIAQANPSMPFTYGDAIVPLSSIDVLFEADEPLTVAVQGTLDDTSRDIGERIAARIKDGSTLQMGIGAVPDAVLNALSGRKGLRFWTEMFSDGVLALDKAGALDRRSASGVVPLRLQRVVRVDRREPAGAGLALPGQQRPGADRPAADDDLGECRASGGPVRPGERLAHQRPDLLRLRWPDGLHRGSPARPRRAGVHRAALVAPEGQRLHDRAAARRAGYVLPAHRRGHRAGHRRDLGSLAGRAGAQPDHPDGAPGRPRGARPRRPRTSACGCADPALRRTISHGVRTRHADDFCEMGHDRCPIGAARA